MATAAAPVAQPASAEIAGSGSPFTRTTILALVLVGALAFFGMLYSLGSGNPLINQNNGRAHAASDSLVGYKALTKLLRAEGRDVELSRTPAGANTPSLLVITADYFSKWEDVEALISGHRYYGPTLVILPKWIAMPAPDIDRNWVRLLETQSYEANFDGADLKTEIGENDAGGAVLQSGFGPAPKAPEKLVTLGRQDLYPMVRDSKSGRPVIGYLDDGFYEWLDGLAERQEIQPSEDDGYYDDIWPVVFVADPDLFNNKGLADQKTALHALGIINAIDDGTDYPIVFDLTANGLGRSDNLLTLAFRPPFLAATICFLVAACMVGWVAFTRFAPPIMASRVIDFGKETLVYNSAATMRLLRREHLLREPYARLVRGIAMRRLNLTAAMDDESVDARLDAQTPDDVMPFTARRAELLAAQKPDDIAAASAALHEWKKDYL
ncbi:MAG: DUF4350 domain-containing protein [Pseudomonadota bacterium]